MSNIGKLDRNMRIREKRDSFAGQSADIVIMKRIHEIMDRGYDAEVRKSRDGTLRVYEIHKRIVLNNSYNAVQI